MEPVEHTVHVAYSPDIDLGYLYLAEIGWGGVTHTEPLVIETPAGVRLINLDFDDSGRLVGIEFDGARASMPPRLLIGL